MSDPAAPTSRPAPAPHPAGSVRIGSIAVILISLLVIFWKLPTDLLIEPLRNWIDSVGVWGPVIYALIYVIAVIIMAPGSLLTLVAGAIFGLVKGTLVVAIGANVGAACAFLIARYLARDTVARKIENRPKFRAVDRAISEGGWKVVALLRLSPAVPFNVQNYMYGLTGVRFATCVLTSLVAMLPGTIMYVYIGHVTGAALQGGGQRSLGQWLLLAVGLAATIAVTVYITRLAKRKLEEQTRLPQSNEASGGASDESAAASEEPRAASRKQRPWAAALAAVVALLLATVAAIAVIDVSLLFKAVGAPPPVRLQESYERRPDGPTVDHSQFDALLKAHVTDGGWVDYAALKNDADKLDAYLDSLAKIDFDALDRDEKLVLLINAYNAATLRLILDHYPVKSILDIPSDQRWDARRWRVAGHTWSLNDIEHKQIRPHFREPRIHFALVCAAVGCPPLRREAYLSDHIEEQLADQSHTIHTHDRWYDLDTSRGVVKLTELYKWYGSDFTQVSGSVLQFVAAQYGGETLAPLLENSGTRPRIEWIPYDWSLNDVKNQP